MKDAAKGRPITLPPGIWGTLLQEAFCHPDMAQEVELITGQPSHDIVVLVSGGLDSSAAYFMAKKQGRGEVVPIYCKIHTGYEDLELRALEKLGIDPLILDFSDFKHNRRRYGYLIPGRNLLFIMAASEFLDKGGEIWLSATEGELKLRGGDKSWQFWGALNAVLGARPYPVRVHFPFSGWSKTDIVGWWLKNVNEASILDTLSCQEGGNIHCGACQACFRRREAPQLDIFMDSGGYSARVSGSQVDIEAYIDCLHQLRPYLNVYANLDTDSPDESNANLHRLLGAGLRPLPVWHPGWAWSIFEDYCKDFDYVAIGGIVGKQKNTWKERLAGVVRPVYYAFEHGVRIHLFGVASLPVLQRVPVYSCDSTSWQVGGRFGTLISFKNGRMRTVRVSRSPKKATYRCGARVVTYDSYLDRNRHNIQEYLRAEGFITRLWRERGVKWHDE